VSRLSRSISATAASKSSSLVSGHIFPGLIQTPLARSRWPMHCKMPGLTFSKIIIFAIWLAWRKVSGSFAISCLIQRRRATTESSELKSKSYGFVCSTHCRRRGIRLRSLAKSLGRDELSHAMQSRSSGLSDTSSSLWTRPLNLLFFLNFWCIRCKLGSESVATDIGGFSIFSHVDVELQTAEDSLP
jgi:hypothetical protein